MIARNKLAVINNPYQKSYLKVLTVCSGGVLRSPTAAALLTQLYDFNTRSCGTEDYALVPLTQELVYWADEIICAENYHLGEVEKVMDNCYLKDEPRPITRVLGIPDMFDYMDVELVRLIKVKFEEWNYDGYNIKV